MSEALAFERDGRDWPMRETSRFVEAGGWRFHLQGAGHGPLLLLLHGTGATTHSWAGLAPRLAEHFTLVAPDLPGHGFTGTKGPRPVGALSLPGMAAAVAALLKRLEVRPALAVGHSAGAAILVRMALDGLIDPAALVSLNGALLPLRGLPGRLFSPAAKLLAQSRTAARFFAWRAEDPAVVGRLLRSTGSTLDARGAELYGRLARNPGHVGAALAMMASWDLEPLAADLPRLRTPLVLVVGRNDRTILPSEARRVRALLPSAEIRYLRSVGHLAHEEQPAEVAALVVEVARSVDVLARAAAPPRTDSRDAATLDAGARP